MLPIGAYQYRPLIVSALPVLWPSQLLQIRSVPVKSRLDSLLAWRACLKSVLSFLRTLAPLAHHIESPDAGPPPACADIMAHGPAADAQMPMGWTSENVASDFDIPREDMDKFAAMSFQRAEAAQKAGRFDTEIVPFNAFVKDPATGQRSKIIVQKDDGIRHGTTPESLAKIRAAFPQWGKARTTGGNASQITDGIAAVMLMTRREAEALGCEILGKWVTTSVAGTMQNVYF
jgi:acetyl-CoA acyltransferase 1